MEMTVMFSVPGVPVGKARPRVVGGHAYTPKKTRDYEDLVRLTYRSGHRGVEFTGAVHIKICAYFPLPKRISEKRRGEYMHDDVPYLHKPDCDNIAKVILDALNGIAYQDDAAVSALAVSKFYTVDGAPRVEVTMRGNAEE